MPCLRQRGAGQQLHQWTLRPPKEWSPKRPRTRPVMISATENVMWCAGTGPRTTQHGPAGSSHSEGHEGSKPSEPGRERLPAQRSSQWESSNRGEAPDEKMDCVHQCDLRTSSGLVLLLAINGALGCNVPFCSCPNQVSKQLGGVRNEGRLRVVAKVVGRPVAPV